MEANKIKVTVAICAYNREQYIKECLESIINQSLYEIEILIINDGSTDNTLSICENYVDSRIVLFSQENKGISFARNVAIQNARGEYLLFVDSDDTISPEACEVLYTIAKNYNVDIVEGKYKYNKTQLDNKIQIPSKLNIMKGEEYYTHCVRHSEMEVIVCNKLIRMEYLKKYKILFQHELKYAEDHLFYLILSASHDLSAIKLNYSFYFYRQDNNNSLTKTLDKRKAELVINQLYQMDSFLKNKSNIFYASMFLLYLHLSSIWLRLDKKDQDEICQKLRREKALVANCFKSMLPNKVYRLQAYCFRFQPRFLKKMYLMKKMGR